MKNVILALFLALTLAPAAAFADDQNQAGTPPTAAQRQAIFQTMQTYHQREEQLHQQFRAQILGSLSPAHRSALANLIGQLAISANPNEQTAAAQVDALLSPGERQQILNAHNTFRAQAKQLHEQMRAALKKELPDGGPMAGHGPGPGMEMRRPEMQPDAGRILLHVLGSVGEGDEHHMWGAHPPAPRR